MCLIEERRASCGYWMGPITYLCWVSDLGVANGVIPWPIESLMFLRNGNGGRLGRLCTYNMRWGPSWSSMPNPLVRLKIVRDVSSPIHSVGSRHQPKSKPFFCKNTKARTKKQRLVWRNNSRRSEWIHTKTWRVRRWSITLVLSLSKTRRRKLRNQHVHINSSFSKCPHFPGNIE